ncbi:MAG: DUF1491 family protein [Pseudomonadota bacterium]
MTDRLKSELTVGAIHRSASAHGAFVTILHKGHREAGMIHLYWRHRGVVTVWSEASGPDGTRGWRCRVLEVSDHEASTILEREKAFDPDLWVVEIDGDVPKESLPGTFFSD